ncbi:MAG: urease accessory protein [Chthoniobacter sp.]|jgi:urease accessory protein|nr:urease accessory protein [Chthoniobacter sp.]
MEIIRRGIDQLRIGFGEIRLRVDRLTLAKRRWRSVADDGREFGFDLEEPLADGSAFFTSEEHSYRIAQTAEPVLEVRLQETPQAARLGWAIGNLHFALEVDGDCVRVADDQALRQLFGREGIAFSEATAVFRPRASPHGH